jgi:hypothetical protein
MTAFCHAEVPLWDDISFHIDGNSKITCGNGSYEHPAPNAFSLPHVSSCPGSTPECRASCYVHGLAKNAPDTYQLYALNAVALHRALLMPSTAARSAEILGRWIRENASAGFRWHVSGDVMHERHADWIYQVCRNSPGVMHWIYTRTFAAVPILSCAENLTVNVSADAYNVKEARRVAALYRARVCYLTRDGSFPLLPEGSVIFPDYGLRGRALDEPTDAPWWQSLTTEERRMVCPADFFGQSQAHRCGPCNKCLVKP